MESKNIPIDKNFFDSIVVVSEIRKALHKRTKVPLLLCHTFEG